MFVAWLLFPLVLLAVASGCGLALERVGGFRLPGTLLPSVGLALIIVLATLTTQSSAIAPLTTWIVLATALTGFALGRRRLRALRFDPWAAGAVLIVFALCAAPVVLSGNATFLGYFVDNDQAYHFALVDQLLSGGHDLAGIPLSGYAVSLREYLGTSYPTGVDVALGAVRPLVAQDVAWVFQPFTAVILAMGAGAIFELTGEAVRSRAMRTACAVVATQAGLVYSFYLEGSIKELATTWIIAVTVALVFATLRSLSARALAPLLIVGIAGLDVLSLAIVPWLGVPFAVFAILALWRARHDLRRAPRGRIAVWAAGLAAVSLVLAAPALTAASTFVSTAGAVLGKAGAGGTSLLGNLLTPLQGWQTFGVWFNGDFRYGLVTHTRIGYALIGVVFAAAVVGALWLIRSRALAPLLLLVGDLVAAVYLFNRASPYAAAKVMMIISMAVVLTAMLGGVALIEAGRRLEGWLLAAVIAAGVLWTDGLAYANSSVAPRGRLAEMGAIGARFSGQGPSFYNQVDEVAIHFLRHDAVFDPATGGVAPRSVLAIPNHGRRPWDPDDLAPAYVQQFHLLVLGRSPRISRPPSNFRLVYQGHYYDVWKRTAQPAVLEHIAIDGGLYPETIPSCSLVLSAAKVAERLSARLAYVGYPPPPAFVPTQGVYPSGWGLVQNDPSELIPRTPGTLTGSVTVPASGKYQVWLEASVSRRFVVRIGGRYQSSIDYALGAPGQFVQLGHISLKAGEQPVRIARGGGGIAPGGESTGMLLGPLMLTRVGDDPGVSQIDPRHADALCGRYLDWIEIVR